MSSKTKAIAATKAKLALIDIKRKRLKKITTADDSDEDGVDVVDLSAGDDKDAKLECDPDEEIAPLTAEEQAFEDNGHVSEDEEGFHRSIDNAERSDTENDENYGEEEEPEEEEEADDDAGGESEEVDEGDVEDAGASSVGKLASRKKGFAKPMKGAPPKKTTAKTNKKKTKKPVSDNDDDGDDDDDDAKAMAKLKKAQAAAQSELNALKLKMKRKSASTANGDQIEAEEAEEEEAPVKKKQKVEKKPIPVKTYADIGLKPDGVKSLKGVKYQVLLCSHKHYETSKDFKWENIILGMCMAQLARDSTCRRNEDDFPLRRTGVFFKDNEYKELPFKQSNDFLQLLDEKERDKLITHAIRQSNMEEGGKGFSGKKVPCSILPEKFYQGLVKDMKLHDDKEESKKSSKKTPPPKPESVNKTPTPTPSSTKKTTPVPAKSVPVKPVIAAAAVVRKGTIAIPFPPVTPIAPPKALEVTVNGDWVYTRLNVTHSNKHPSESTLLSTTKQLIWANISKFATEVDQVGKLPFVSMQSSSIYNAITGKNPSDFLTTREQSMLYYCWLLWTTETNTDQKKTDAAIPLPLPPPVTKSPRIETRTLATTNTPVPAPPTPVSTPKQKKATVLADTTPQQQQLITTTPTAAEEEALIDI
jgi:hypothetical protein